MLTLMLMQCLAADPPRYAGGITPTPLAQPPSQEDRVSELACTAETLKTSHTCIFDGRPSAATDLKAQAQANVAFANQVGSSLCRQRTETLVMEAKDRASKAKACAAWVERIAGPRCGIEGKEGLVDAEGRFGSKAKACYLAIAEALQLMEAPAAPPQQRGSPGQTDL